MGYLNNQVVEIDAILTKKGRELLAKNPQSFNIAKFALGDDEIDYRLWNPNHSLGTDYYGEVIENMPILEGSPNEEQMMKFKLITLTKDVTYIPTISIGTTYVELYSGTWYVIKPETINIPDGNSALGYTATLSDNTYFTISTVQGYEVPISTSGTGGAGFSSTSITTVGFRFRVDAKYNNSGQNQTATVTITGNETGGRVTLNLTLLSY